MTASTRLSGATGTARFACVLALGLGVALPGLAAAESLATSASSAGSSASSAGSASLRGSSDSIRASSGSSSEEQPKVAEGEYRVIAVATAAGQTDLLTLTVEPVAANGGGFELDVPARAFGGQPLAAGDRIAATQRPYGLEFARTGQGPFFLVMAEAWQRDLQTHVVRP